MFWPVRGDVVDDLWTVDLVGDGLEVVNEAALFGLVVVRRDEEQGVGAGVRGALGEESASRVLFEPVPAMTGTSSTESTTASTTSTCSSWVSVADSPVEPTGTRPSTPAASRRWASSRSVSKSILRSASSWNGVHIAGEHAGEVDLCHRWVVCLDRSVVVSESARDAKWLPFGRRERLRPENGRNSGPGRGRYARREPLRLGVSAWPS